MASHTSFITSFICSRSAPLCLSVSLCVSFSLSLSLRVSPLPPSPSFPSASYRKAFLHTALDDLGVNVGRHDWVRVARQCGDNSNIDCDLEEDTLGGFYDELQHAGVKYVEPNETDPSDATKGHMTYTGYVRRV